MTFKVRPRGQDQDRGQEYAIAKYLQELKERVVVMERCGAYPKEMSDEVEESTEEANPQGEIDLVRLLKSFVVSNSIIKNTHLD